MAENALAKKMKLRAGQRAALVKAPEGYLKELSPLPNGVELAEKLTGKFDWVQVFVKNKTELDNLISSVVRVLKPDTLVWISYPKGTSKLQTDLTRDRGWEVLRTLDLKWLTLISVNATWSAFGLRPYRSGEARQTFR
jgi:hypothetical protein